MTSKPPAPAIREPVIAQAVATASVKQVLRRLDTSADGLSSAQVCERLAQYGPNAIHTHRVSAWAVLARQLNNAVLILLAVTAVLSYFLGDDNQALIIGVILAASIGLGFFNEYRAEQAAAALHSRVRHTAIVRRDQKFVDVDVGNLVPGDVIRLSLGQAVPADVRLIQTAALECDESILSGESTGSEKSPTPVGAGAALIDMSDLAFMGTIVSAGEGLAVVFNESVTSTLWISCRLLTEPLVLNHRGVRLHLQASPASAVHKACTQQYPGGEADQNVVKVPVMCDYALIPAVTDVRRRQPFAG